MQHSRYVVVWLWSRNHPPLYIGVCGFGRCKPRCLPQ